MTACTDLVTKEVDSQIIATTAGGTTTGNATDLLISSYKDFGGFTDQAAVYSLNEHTTDELIPPTRGVDWGDNGVWRSLYTQTWDPTHANVLNTWNNLNAAAYKDTQILAASPTAAQTAEAKFLRAFNMFHVMDLYGQVPFRNATDGVDVNPKVYSRSDAFDFIVKDLTEALTGLSSIGPSATNTTASKAAANALLARLYLNKAVYKAASPAGPYTFDPADMTKVIQYADAVTADGFSLEPSYFNNFTLNASKEIILTVRHDTGTPQNRIWMTLHYDQNPSGWNGFATLADFYGKFESTDGRLGAPSPVSKGSKYYGINRGFLIGQQYDDKGTAIVDSRSQKPLVFSKDVPLSGAATEKGIRVIKYHPADYDAGTQYVLLRYADVYLMKAEAIARGGSSSTTALQMVNALRAVRGASALTTVDANAIYDERGRELYWEGYRRLDMIRYGKFNGTWSEKTNTETFRVLFPIPQQAVDSNPNLKQNSGY
jgi:hypothetical protein